MSTTATATATATIRFITADNANSLGYADADYDEDGMWVLERAGDEWIADLPDVDETDVQAAKAAAESILGVTDGEWRSVVSGYGMAYQLST